MASGQSISNQQPEFNAPFFSTCNLSLAGNDSEGLQYGLSSVLRRSISFAGRRTKQDDKRYKLDKYLLKMCTKETPNRVMYDFILSMVGTQEAAACAPVFWG